MRRVATYRPHAEFVAALRAALEQTEIALDRAEEHGRFAALDALAEKYRATGEEWALAKLVIYENSSAKCRKVCRTVRRWIENHQTYTHGVQDDMRRLAERDRMQGPAHEDDLGAARDVILATHSLSLALAVYTGGDVDALGGDSDWRLMLTGQLASLAIAA